MSTSRKSQLLLGIGGVTVVLLLAGVFTLGSLTLPFEPRDQVVLYALSTFLVAALLVFLFILARTLARLGIERLAHKPGSRFKTKMVLAAIAVSFLPVIFLFFVSYALLNRTLTKWFPHALEVATDESVRLLSDMSEAGAARRAQLALSLAPIYSAGQPLRVGPATTGSGGSAPPASSPTRSSAILRDSCSKLPTGFARFLPARKPGNLAALRILPRARHCLPASW